MAGADANQVSLSYRRKDSAGVVVGMIDEWRQLKFTADGLKQTTDTVPSTTIRDDRMVEEIVRTGAQVDGDLAAELRYKIYDEFLQELLQSLPWTSLAAISGTDIQATAAEEYISGTVNAFTGLAAGDIVEVSGFVDPANNGFKRVISVTTTTLTDDTLTVELPDLVVEAAGPSVTITPHDVPKEDISGTIYSTTSGVNTLESTTAEDFAALVVGDIIRISGFTESANNGLARISVINVTNDILTLEFITLVTEAAGDTVTIEPGSYITQGVNKNSFDVEREYNDLAGEFANFDTLFSGNGSLDIPLEGVMTLTLSMLGGLETSAAVTSVTTLIAAASNKIYQSVDHIPRIVEGGSGSSDFSATSFNMAVNNNLRKRPILGSIIPDGYGSGSALITGALTQYFQNKAIFDKYLDFEDSELWLVLQDTAGNVYIIEVPRIKYTDGSRIVSGENTDVIAEMTWESFRHETKAYQLRIHRLAS